MSKKTIWVINQFAGKYDSGAAERHYFFAKKWKEKGYKVIIFSGSFNHLFSNQPVMDNENFTFENLEKGLSFVWVKIPKHNPKNIVKRLLAQLIFSFRIAFMSLKSYDLPNIIIASSPTIFSSFSGWILKKRIKNSLFIFEIRDLWPLSAIHLLNISKWHPVVMFMSWFEKIGYKKSDRIVTLLPYAGKHIKTIIGGTNKIDWISNGIDEEMIGKEELPDEITMLLPKNKFIIGYTGAIGIANALEFFVEAANKIKNENIHFIIVGEGYLKKDLIKKTDKNNITFIPKIKKTQVQSMLKSFNVCYIGRHDTVLFDYGVASNKYFDYMLAGKPILVSSRKIKDPVELSGCGIIVQPENALAIIKGVNELYKMTPQELFELGNKGYNYVKKYHNFDYLSEKYISVFQKK